MTYAEQTGFGLGIFQLTALPIAQLLLAWIVRPSGREVEAARSALARKKIARSQWVSRMLLIPPLGYFVSGGLSVAFPRYGMTLLGITTFAEMWFFIFLIAFNRKFAQENLVE